MDNIVVPCFFDSPCIIGKGGSWIQGWIL